MTTMLTRREILALMGALAVSGHVLGADDTFKGEMVCAKCYLKKPDAKECQDVLLVKGARGETVEYYVTKNEVAQEAGEACTEAVPATITGTVMTKDGRNWITATKIVKGK